MKKILLIMIYTVSFSLLGTTLIYSMENGGPSKIDAALDFADALKEEDQNSGSTFEFRIEQTRYKFWMFVTIVSSTVVCLLIVLWFMDRSQTFRSTDLVNVSGLVLVIQAILVSVIVALTTEQLTASIGALGAIAGYLFGRTKSRPAEQKPTTV